MKDIREIIFEDLKKNKSKEEIYLNLLKKGLLLDDISQAFTSVSLYRWIPVGKKTIQKVETVKVVKENSQDAQKRIVKIVLILGVLLFSAGIFSFVVANWHAVPPCIKIFNATFLMSLFYGIGLYLEKNKKHKITGKALQFLGFMTYGGTLFFTQFILDLPYSKEIFSLLVLLWAAGGLLMSTVIDLPIILYSSSALVVFCFIDIAILKMTLPALCIALFSLLYASYFFKDSSSSLNQSY